jgi:hypothetical protein
MRFVAVGGSIMALALLAAQPAAASTVETDCANLAATLTAATPGETIVLSGLCTDPNANFVLPKTAELTIEGAASGVNGFDGTGAGGAALTSPAEGVDGLTLRNLTFENYEGSGGAFIESTKTATHPFAFIHDTFLHNTTSDHGGGLHMTIEEPAGTCAFSGAGPPVTLADSSFSENTATFQAGGGAYIDLECHAGSISASVTGNVFTNNRVVSNDERLQGGGLFVGLGHAIIAVPFSLTQQNNRFEGNVIENTAAEGLRVEGGGEFTDGGAVSSLDDRFIGNRIDGAKSSTRASEGGGFASLDPGECTTTPGATSTATNLVAVGNTIGPPSGTGAGGEGAGVYVGCAPGGGGYHLTLVNSTISGNTATGAGASAGLDGETNDTAVLENTIVAGNLLGSDLGGFGASDGENVSATFSDLCAIGSATLPFAGAGNICASPALANAPGGDAHETAASPTIDAGSNGLIGAVAVDVFGVPRILAGRTGDAPTVDIGAAESPAAPPLPFAGVGLKTFSPQPTGTAKASRVRVFPGGVTVTITCSGPPGQTCSGAVTLKTVETLRGARVVAVASAAPRRHKRTVTVGTASYNALKAGRSVTLRLKLNAKGRALLRRFHRLPVRAAVTQRTASGTATISTARLRIPSPRASHHH